MRVASGLLRGGMASAPSRCERFATLDGGGVEQFTATKFITTMFPAPGTEPIRVQVTSELLATPQFVMVSAAEGMFGADQPDWDPHHVDVPVLAINAPNPMWNDDYKGYLRTLSPRTEYRMIDGTGHWLMLEKPAEFNAILLEMLTKYGLITN